ncbi:MAG: bacteriorhodopsin [Cyclobacteriaceae bacterium]
MEALGNATFENYIALEGISEMAFQMTAHVLTLGYAAMLAGLFYFILTIKSVAPKYRISSVLSVVVMTSAFLLLFKQASNWEDALNFDATQGLYFLGAGNVADLFNNGYRYLNWLIDVPMLLFQILFVVSLTRSNFSSVRNQFWFSGSLMIITGYIGQYYEVTNITAYLVWGAISTAFFIHILILMNRVIKEGKEGIPESAKKSLGSIWTIFLISWFLYPGAYLMPHLFGFFNEAGLYNESGIVGRQITYTVADVMSKVIYGVLLTVVAQKMSKAEGYDPDAAKA